MASVRTSLGQFFLNFQMVVLLLMIVTFFLSPGNKIGLGLESHWKFQKCQNFTKIQFASINCYRCCTQPSSLAKLHVWWCQGGVFIGSYCFLRPKVPIFGWWQKIKPKNNQFHRTACAKNSPFLNFLLLFWYNLTQKNCNFGNRTNSHFRVTGWKLTS